MRVSSTDLAAPAEWFSKGRGEFGVYVVNAVISVKISKTRISHEKVNQPLTYKTFHYPLDQQKISKDKLEAPLGGFLIKPNTISYLGSFQLGLHMIAKKNQTWSIRQAFTVKENINLIFKHNINNFSQAKKYLYHIEISHR